MLELERAWLFRNHFRLNSKLRRRAETVIAQYRRRTSCLIAVHVRRTDYKKLLGERSEIVRSGHQTPSVQCRLM